MDKPNETAEKGTDAVPLFGRWRNAYFAVVAFFILDVVLFYFFGRYFS